jgi:hypothetical protein
MKVKILKCSLKGGEYQYPPWYVNKTGEIVNVSIVPTVNIDKIPYTINQELIKEYYFVDGDVELPILRSDVEMELTDEAFFEEAYKSICEMQIEKNKRYAESALKPLNVFAKHHPYGSRIDEKLARIQTADVLRKNDVADIIGGCMLLCKANGWVNFKDLID